MSTPRPPTAIPPYRAHTWCARLLYPSIRQWILHSPQLRHEAVLGRSSSLRDDRYAKSRVGAQSSRALLLRVGHLVCHVASPFCPQDIPGRRAFSARPHPRACTSPFNVPPAVSRAVGIFAGSAPLARFAHSCFRGTPVVLLALHRHRVGRTRLS